MGPASRCGPGIAIDAGVLPFGWASAGIGWREHNLIIDRRPRVRSWGNRGTHVHPFSGGIEKKPDQGSLLAQRVPFPDTWVSQICAQLFTAGRLAADGGWPPKCLFTPALRYE